MERTEAHRKARLAAEESGTFLEPLTYDAITCGIFKKPGKDSDYSFSWVIGRLKNNDMKVAKKLIKFAATSKSNG